MTSTILSFCFGISIGGFAGSIIIREAVPLRDHYAVILLSLLLAVPILVFIFIWYYRVLAICKVTLGDKGGNMINSILSFLLGSIVLLFLVIIGIFYAAVV